MLTLLLLVPLVLYPLLRAAYNITFHPLASYPGPKLWGAFAFPVVYNIFRGRLPKRLAELHNQYGPVVRITPTELSFTSAQACRDIYGARAPQLPKDKQSYVPPDEYNGKRISMEPNDAKHKAMRDQLSHAFAPKALLEHQPLITEYVDQLVSVVRDQSDKASSFDLGAYFNWTTFDIIGHLTFGTSFGCLDNLAYHPWVTVIFDFVCIGHMMNQLDRYGLLTPLLKVIPKGMQKARNDMVAYSNSRMDARIQEGFGPGTRKDFVHFMHEGSRGEKCAYPEITSRDSMCANGETIIVAGSETTATLLTGTTFLLLTKRPDYMERVKAEVRAAFTDDSIDEINFKSVTEKLPLMIAALREGLRYYPPAPSGFARKVVNTPKTIDGHVVPPNTSVSMSQFAACHYADNFHEADEFLPERWLADATWEGSPYQHDQRDSSQPFSMGPRNCIGKPLAEIESRLIFAKMMYNFDFELNAGQENWMDKQTMSLIWGKGPLMVKVKDVRA